MFRIVQLAGPLLSAGAIVSFNSSLISNESSSRRFYEDEANVVPRPGTVVAAPASEIESLGENKIIDGISVRSTKTTENFFKTARQHASVALTELNHWLNKQYTNFNDTERFVTTTVSDLHYKREDILPNGIYVIIAILSGTVAARTRGVISKVCFPTIAGLAAFRYFLPVTFDNTRVFAWKLEQKNVPSFAKQQEDAYHGAIALAKSIEEGTERNIKRVEDGTQSLRKSIADITGLNLDEEVSKKK
ncbi:uncharacterized protein LODBEIA_P26810 [Lodderomyces beijingensis]|uniref:MICOS complex subunit n=1 Tax=Lodderomyces beijingensis TaxID=1775926 RepID=A0ABP0ZJY1_9ASCO